MAKAARITLIVFAAAIIAGCSTLEQPAIKHEETAAQRFGSYCEGLGHLKGTPGFDACVRKMRQIYPDEQY